MAQPAKREPQKAFRLRPAEEPDIPFIVAQETRPDYARFICRWPEPRHRANLSDPDIRTVIWVGPDGHPRGFAILVGCLDPSEALELARMVLANPGGGGGAAMLDAVIALAFASLHAPLLRLDVFTDNPRARRLYAKAGFREERIVEAPLIRPDGSPGQLVIMSLARAHWRPGKPPAKEHHGD
jgi:ribosomal protein S18 acetylase RimI-like enzyme